MIKLIISLLVAVSLQGCSHIIVMKLSEESPQNSCNCPSVIPDDYQCVPIHFETNPREVNL